MYYLMQSTAIVKSGEIEFCFVPENISGDGAYMYVHSMQCSITDLGKCTCCVRVLGGAFALHQ